MPTSNENDAKGFNKLALLASAAATAAFVISQTRLMQRLAEPPATTTLTPPDRDEPEAVAVATPEAVEQDEPHAEALAAAPETDHTDDDHSLPPPASPSSGGRVRFRSNRSARERLHYGLPVNNNRRSRQVAPPAVTPGAATETEPTPATLSIQTMTPVALLEPPAPAVETAPDNEEEFDAEYLAICEAIARDGRLDDAELEEDLEPAVAAKTQDPVEDMWWLPAPRLQYIFLALAYVAIAVAVGSDPVTLTAAGVRALTTVDSTADLVLLGWILCGVIVVLPLGNLAARLVSLAAHGKVHLPGVISHQAAESAGWGVRLLAISAFVAGAVLYTPQALSWALGTDYPIAAVSSSTMAPALHEGELVLIEGVDSIDELHSGDIVAFRHDGGLSVRRVVEVRDDNIVAKADASPDEDIVVPFGEVAGRVLTLAGTQVKLPLLGNVSLLGERTVDPAAAASE